MFDVRRMKNRLTELQALESKYSNRMKSINLLFCTAQEKQLYIKLEECICKIRTEINNIRFDLIMLQSVTRR